MASLILKKPTPGDFFISDVGVIIPGSGQDTFTDDVLIRRLASSFVTRDAVSTGTLVVNDGVSDFSPAAGLEYLETLWVRAGFDTSPTGVSGFSGFSGASGVIGSTGTSGFSGVSGFSGTSGYSGTSGVSGANRAKYPFGNTSTVPAGGTQQLQAPGQSLNGYRLMRAGTITGASIAVNVASANSYNLDVRINGSSVATLALAAGATSNSTVALSVAVVVGDILTAFMVRTAGSGGSTFSEQSAAVEVTES